MTHIGTPEVRGQVCRRLGELQTSSRALWGKMNAHQMVCHLNDSFRLALGEKQAGSIANLFRRTVMKWGALYVPAPWPKGTPTMPEMEQGVGGTPPGIFEDDRAALLESIDRFGKRPGFEGIHHPFFGKMSNGQWMRWGYLHADHHLRQFGL